MAVTRPGHIVADIRGKVGNIIFSRNQGGPYVRSTGPTPADPTDQQQECRDAMTQLSRDWGTELTEANRRAWQQYARTYKMLDRWGKATYENGYSYFVRCNFNPMRILGTLFYYSPPTRAPLHLPEYAFTAAAAENLITIELPIISYPAPDFQLRLWLSIGRPCSPGQSSYMGPWNFVDQNTCIAGIWTREPWTITAPHVLIRGQKIWTCITAQDAESGAISNGWQTMAEVA